MRYTKIIEGIITPNILKTGKKLISVALLALLAGCAVEEERPPLVKYWHSGTERPYVIRGVKYYPQVHYKYDAIGCASWYGYDCHGLPTASGRIFRKDGMTGAHRTLPLPCVVLVENLQNGKKVKLLLNDRGPFARTNERIIDVSQRAAELLGFRARGYAKVRVICLPKESVIAAKKYGRRPYPTDL
jgi:rare lipoprotein A